MHDFAKKQGHAEPVPMEATSGRSLDALSMFLGVVIGAFFCVVALQLLESRESQATELPDSPSPHPEKVAIEFEFYEILTRNDLHPPYRLRPSS